jgi:23S rRNA pseudouridine1911/1915/1917 synthase
VSETFSILYEDADLAVVRKAPGLLSQRDASRDPDLLTLFEARYRAQGVPSKVFAVHRLDRGVGGLMVLARTERSAAALSAAISDHTVFIKEYLAVLHGVLQEREAVLRDYLYHDERARRTSAVSKDHPRGKLAVLTYRMVDSIEKPGKKPLSLARIRLQTGRTHQIRAQLSAHGHPLAGDGRYGARDRYGEIALFSAQLSFLHPRSGERLSFQALPDQNSAFSEFEISDSIFERSLPE